MTVLTTEQAVVTLTVTRGDGTSCTSRITDIENATEPLMPVDEILRAASYSLLLAGFLFMVRWWVETRGMGRIARDRRAAAGVFAIAAALLLTAGGFLMSGDREPRPQKAPWRPRYSRAATGNARRQGRRVWREHAPRRVSRGAGPLEAAHRQLQPRGRTSAPAAPLVCTSMRSAALAI